MKALVLCGGIPQAALLLELKKRGIYTILADMNPNVMARPYADEFFPVSVLDVDAVRELAIEQEVDMVLTACADQVLLVQAQVSEELGLPCYIDYKTAREVSSKELMKRTFTEYGIPTSRYIIMDYYNSESVNDLNYPVIVKPVDSYSSRGVKKVLYPNDLESSFKKALQISRTKKVIIEEFVEGEELTIDAYIEEGNAHILCISYIDKVPDNDRFVICRTRYPAQISENLMKKVEDIANSIAQAFQLKDSPMLIQMITDGNNVSVVEFCARTGGGDKFQLIKKASKFDVIKAVVDLTLGEKPHIEEFHLEECIVNEFLYTKPGVLHCIKGFDEMKERGIISDYYQLKTSGTTIGGATSSGDRVAYYSIQAPTMTDVRYRDTEANKHLQIIDTRGEDILRHDLIAVYEGE